MYCGKCGAKLLKGNMFCTSCGAKIDPEALQNASQTEVLTQDTMGVDVTRQAPNTPPTYVPKPGTINNPEKGNIILIGISILLSVLIIASIAFFYKLFTAPKKSDLASLLESDLTISDDKGSVSDKNSSESESTPESTPESGSTPTVEPTTEPTIEPTIEPTPEEETSGTPAATPDSDYIIPGSDQFYLAVPDIMHLSKQELRLARNEIYARHGRMFDSQDLQDYFNSKPWYIPSIPAAEFSDNLLNEVEKYNVTLIKDYEDSIN